MTTPDAPDLRSRLADLIAAATATVASGQALPAVTLDRPRQADHGDFACNVAMQLARALKRNPREIAAAIVAALPASPLIERAEVAGAGFINLFLRAGVRLDIVRQVLEAGAAYGRSSGGGGRSVQVEFVSANPTGPLHVGHGRGAAYGASLANVLAAVGYAVQREYYVNDAGRQMDILAVSAWIRYLGECGIEVEFPPNGYQGDYVRLRGRELRERFGEQFARPVAEVVAGLPAAAAAASAEALEANVEQRMDVLIANAKTLLADDYRALVNDVLERQVAEIRAVLDRFGVTFDRWYSEQSLYDTGRVSEALAKLDRAGHLYHKDGAQWFRSTAFGDDKDRVVQRENGLHTYFASDIAYHHDKLERGYGQLIDVWGADHHGYITRVRAAIGALGHDPAKLTVPLIQLVALYRGGEPVKMGKRSGSYVTLEDLCDEVGVDATRYFYLARKCDQHLDFDLDLARSQSSDNPVYYIQYAHARISSVLAEGGIAVAALRGADLTPLDSPHELALASRVEAYPGLLEAAARDLAPHAVAFYLKDLAADFHSYYNAKDADGRYLYPMLLDDPRVQSARLALIAAVRIVLANGLALLGVSAPEKM